MRILFIDRDPDHARDLYSQLLSYKGVPWDLLHSTTLAEAATWLERDQFDLILLTIYQQDQASDGYEALIRREIETPIVVLSDSPDTAEHAEFVRIGAHDCLRLHSVNGAYVMRRLRMAVSRFHRTPPGTGPAGASGPRTEPRLLQECKPGATLDATLEVAGEFATIHERMASTATLEESGHTTLLVDDTSTQNLFESRPDSQYLSVDSLRAAAGLIEENHQQFQAVIIEQGVIEREGINELLKVRQELIHVPMLVAMVDRSDTAAITLIEYGVDDCEIAATANQATLERAVLLARTRLDREREAFEAALGVDAEVSDRRSKPREASDRRRVTRYLCSQPIMAIPVLPNGAPDPGQVCQAVTADISTVGVGLQLPSTQILPSRNWLLGIQGMREGDSDYQLHYANVVVRNVSYTGGGVRMGTTFQHPMDDLLRPSNLQPQLNLQNHQLLPELPLSVLDAWAELGVLKRILMQRHHSCPECSAIVAIGNGCRECGSPRYEFQNMIHHFACAYFGLEEEFDNDGSLACPKCRMKDLVAGADFELIKARYHCDECGFEGNELEQVCNCLNCRLRFPTRMAREQMVFGYDVERLDILAFLSSAS